MLQTTHEPPSNSAKPLPPQVNLVGIAARAEEIQSTNAAFAAIKSDGTVVRLVLIVISILRSCTKIRTVKLAVVAMNDEKA